MQKKNVAHNLYGKDLKRPPDSYLIFSQEVSNCLNSYAKRFNFKHKRKGGLFGDRYSKHLIESEEEMQMWIGKLNSLQKLVNFSKHWQVNDDIKLTNALGEISSWMYYKGNGSRSVGSFFENFTLWVRSNMRGCFLCLPPSSVRASDYAQKHQNFINKKGYAPPW